jgi:hypothetical protein
MEYKCNICDKIYKTYQTLWKHNKQFHSALCKDLSSDVNKMSSKCQVLSSNIICEVCYKEFNTRQAKSLHKKKCIIIKQNNDNIEVKKLELQLKNQEHELLLKEKEILKLKLKLEKSKKADICTVNQLNKLLLERHTQYQNYINNINNGTIQNNIHNGNIQNIVNNFQLVGFGKEDDIVELLTIKEKKQILDSKYKSLEKFIEIVHCGKYNKFKNILVTNIKDNYMYKFDDSKGQFILSTKDEIINSLIDNRIYELETIYDDFLLKDKLDEKTKNIIEELINKINYSESKYVDSNGHEHHNYKQYKISEIKLILYNNKDKITNDISLLLTTSDA